MVFILFTEKDILRFLRKQPLKKSYQHAECFADNELAEMTI